ncbi:uncharacterized protein PITG_17221, partial [Phytophthora infestans T30-4]
KVDTALAPTLQQYPFYEVAGTCGHPVALSVSSLTLPFTYSSTSQACGGDGKGRMRPVDPIWIVSWNPRLSSTRNYFERPTTRVSRRCPLPA